MEFTSILDQLMRHRRLALLGIVPALVVAFAVATGKVTGARGETDSASVQVLLRAPGSSPVDLDPRTGDGLAAHAQLIGDLMSTDDFRAGVAVRAGIAPELLTVVAPSFGQVEDEVPIAVQSVIAASAKTPYVLTIRADESSPIMTVRATAPTRSQAVDVARSAEDGLAVLIADHGAGTAGLSLAELGPPRSRVARDSSRLPLGFVAAIATFALWCAAVVIVTGLLRGGGGRYGYRWSVGRSA